jgi:hypothetical membrane protein
MKMKYDVNILNGYIERGQANLDIFNYPLSRFSLNDKTSSVWFMTLIGLSYIVIINAVYHVWYSTIQYKRMVYIAFITAILGLLGLTIFDMGNIFYHDLFAVMFFFSYSIAIFLYGFFHIKIDFRTAMTSIIVSILMLMSFTWLVFHIFSIPELAYIFLCYFWNGMLIFNNEWKKILKSIGF